MIFTDRTIIVQKGTSSINDTIILYRGDKGVEIRFTLNEGSPFRFGSGASPNIIEKTEAAYGQLIIKAPNGLPSIFSEIAPTNGGKIVFTITAEMIDEITEVGNYAFQIRLFDENRESRATLPEVENGIEIREPIATEDVSTTNEVGVATVGYAITTAAAPEDAFDTQGNYNKTTWGTGDRITDAKLNKIEAAIDGVNKKVASVGTGGEVDLSGYVTKEVGNANQITFADGQTFQAKLDAGTLKGDKGDPGEQGPAGTNGKDGLTTSISVNGNTYTQIDGVITLPNYPSAGGGSGTIFENIEVGEIFTSVEEVIECTGITLSTNTLSFTTTNTQTLSAVISPTNCTQVVAWSVEPVGIVTVNDGVVTPVANGTATITATCGSKSATCNVTVSGIVKQYTVTNNLSNVTTNNNVNTVNENASYTATLTANENYAISAVTVTMGDIDITDTAYVGGVITINNVTGNIVITARGNSTIVSPAIRAKIETIDAQDYLVIEDWGNVRNLDGTSTLKITGYSNDNYQIYSCRPDFIGLWNTSNTTPFIPMINSIAKSTGDGNNSLLNDPQEGNLYLYYDPAMLFRLPKDLSSYDNSIDKYMKDTYGGMKFALATCNTKEIDPNKITSITVKEDNENSQYAQFGYSDLPTKNIYNGVNSLNVNTSTNANLSGATAPAFAMSTSNLSIKFLPGTFADFTLDAVKTYLTENPLIFWYN